MSAQTEVPLALEKRIHTVRIFPPIGIARVGNSVENNGWFYGPEVPGRFDEPEGGFKDVHGAVKRQVKDTYLPTIMYGC
jgi:L-Lysine epsilon oxidase N-terminal